MSTNVTQGSTQPGINAMPTIEEITKILNKQKNVWLYSAMPHLR